MLLSLEHITKYHNEKVILKDVSFSMDEKDKIGIIGVNGTGKTTFLRILLGSEHYDDGKIIKKNGLKIHYLPQNPTFDHDLDVLTQTLNQVQAKDQSVKLFEVKSILTKLGLSDFDKKISLLSGGQAKRLALACALVTPCDLLILDEPTNHLDNDMIAFLETFLRKLPNALLMVTHDRYFLERITNRLLEIDQGSIYMYEGNYENYLEGKEKRLSDDVTRHKKLNQLYLKELSWMRAGVQARGTKSQSRIDRFNDLRKQRQMIQSEKLEMSSLSTRLGKKTIELHSIKKSFGDHLLFKDFSYFFKQQDRIGILGNNGCGKTTLLKCIAGDEELDEGSIVIGETVHLGYFKQGDGDMDESMRVIDYIKEVSDLIETKNGSISAKTMLERFMFPSTLQHSLIGRLSKGECRRLYLLRLLMSSPNVLMLDEPTNNLDIQTLAVLEDYLDEFVGIVITVSHDRYFLDRVCDSLFVFQKDQRIKEYTGGYSDYMSKVEVVKESKPNTHKEYKKTTKLKFTSAEKREFESIDEDMEQLELKIKDIDEKMNLACDDFNQLSEYSKIRDTLSLELDHKTERWMYLNELDQEIQKDNKN
ncbi:MAG: ABC-F family ATP-binding cassette domain-containing protein [Erysipelotrichaceae bacterium]